MVPAGPRRRDGVRSRPSGNAWAASWATRAASRRSVLSSCVTGCRLGERWLVDVLGRESSLGSLVAGFPIVAGGSLVAGLVGGWAGSVFGPDAACDLGCGAEPPALAVAGGVGVCFEGPFGHHFVHVAGRVAERGSSDLVSGTADGFHDADPVTPVVAASLGVVGCWGPGRQSGRGGR